MEADHVCPTAENLDGLLRLSRQNPLRETVEGGGDKDIEILGEPCDANVSRTGAPRGAK